MSLHVPTGSVGHVVDENTKSSYTEIIKVIEFFHEGVDTGSHSRFVRKTDPLL